MGSFTHKNYVCGNILFKDMQNICWFSRHQLTNGQVKTLTAAGFNCKEQHNIMFNDKILEQIQSLTDSKIIALVAPLAYGLTLLRAGYIIIEFVNIPSARQKGVFLCKGLNIHTLESTEFVPCPISPDQQEEGNLNYNK